MKLEQDINKLFENVQSEFITDDVKEKLQTLVEAKVIQISKDKVKELDEQYETFKSEQQEKLEEAAVSYVEEHLIEKIDSYLTMAGIQKGDSVLDVATGNGVVAYRLAKRGCRVVAMDIIPTPCLERMENTTYLVKDAEEMDFKRQFDAVTVRNSFHYFPNPRQVLRNIRTALRKNGTLLIMQPIATESSYPFLKHVFEKKAPVRTFFTEDELLDVVESEKFTIIHTKIEDYANWVRTDHDEKIKGIHTSYSKGILYFSIPRGYIILLAKKS